MNKKFQIDLELLHISKSNEDPVSQGLASIIFKTYFKFKFENFH